jgi:hypothetical protein
MKIKEIMNNNTEDGLSRHHARRGGAPALGCGLRHPTGG